MTWASSGSTRASPEVLLRRVSEGESEQLPKLCRRQRKQEGTTELLACGHGAVASTHVHMHAAKVLGLNSEGR